MSTSSFTENALKKKEFKAALMQFLEKKGASISAELISLKEDMMNETKSSAGDKFETGREMMQQSLSQLEAQRDLVKRHLQLCTEISSKASLKVTSGSLISTNLHHFFIGLALGKVQLNGLDYYLLSEKAPIAQTMLGKTAGEQFKFRNQTIRIKAIY
jgi:hypothetical protein